MRRLGLIGGSNGKDWCRKRAISDPGWTLTSQDNYLFFAEEIQRGEPLP